MAAEIQVEKYAGKLNRTGYDAFIKAMSTARGEGHRHVDVLHWLYHVVSNKQSDISVTLGAMGLDRGRVLTDLTTALAQLDKNVTEIPAISDSMAQMLKNGWVYATLLFGEVQVRSGHALVALLSSSEQRRVLSRLSSDLGAMSADMIAKETGSLWRDSEEGDMRPMDGSGLTSGDTDAPDGPAGQTPLGRFAKDMTAAAATMDQIVGRDDEIRQIVDVLLRRRQNNPILTGEAGVGKTAVVEGFAQRLAANDVPPALRGTKLYELDIQSMQAGASMKGEFEQRLKSVIDEVQSSPTPIILFIDEAHTLIGAGGAAGTGDAANLLKPALARGTLRTIAATTFAEYRNYFEKDPALTRRFQPVDIEEPDVERCCFMLRGILGPMEAHHGVRISDEAIVAAVSLSARYIPARQLPDKAVSLLDTACARVAVSQSSTPARIGDLRQAIRAADVEIASKEAERELGRTDEDRLTEVVREKAEREAELADVEVLYEAERDLVAEVLNLRKRITEALGRDAEDVADACPEDETGEITGHEPEDIDAAHAELAAKMAQLEDANPDDRMVYAHVDAQSVATVISDWTGIPAGRMVQDELAAVLTLADRLKERVIGQDHGLQTIAKRIETSRAGLANPEKPIGVFMLCGPSGVGKTETALALAETLYGGEQNIITINMSEFQEAHSVSLLKGAPPGYVGYGEGGRLTEAVRRKPYSVVLLDEIEKAHPDVHELFFQVFDKGIMEDGNGRAINFKNCLILLTSNVGTEVIMEMAEAGETDATTEELAAALRPFQLDVFPPALLGRLVSIPYYPLGPAALGDITRLKLRSVAKRLKASHNAEMVYGNDVLNHITEQCKDPDSGGRMIDNIITNSILPEMSRKVLEKMVAGEEFKQVEVTYVDGAFKYAFKEKI